MHAHWYEWVLQRPGIRPGRSISGSASNLERLWDSQPPLISDQSPPTHKKYTTLPVHIISSLRDDFVSVSNPRPATARGQMVSVNNDASAFGTRTTKIGLERDRGGGCELMTMDATEGMLLSVVSVYNGPGHEIVFKRPIPRRSQEYPSENMHDQHDISLAGTVYIAGYIETPYRFRVSEEQGSEGRLKRGGFMPEQLSVARSVNDMLKTIHDILEGRRLYLYGAYMYLQVHSSSSNLPKVS